MHIHAGSMNLNSARHSSAAGAEKAAAAQRAAEVRKKLRKRSQALDGAASTEETWMIDNWLNADTSPNRDAAYGKDPDFG